MMADGDESDLDITVVKSLRESYGGTQRATVIVPVAAAKRILSKGRRILISLVNAHIAEVVRPLKCYKCWEYGHLAIKCTGVDRAKNCAKCGEVGHKIAACSRPPQCTLCHERDSTMKSAHIAGSSRCPVYQKALQEFRAKS